MLYKLEVDRIYKTPYGIVNYYTNKKFGKTCTVTRSYDSDYTIIQGGDDIPRFVTERDVIGDTICITNDPNDNNYNNKEPSTLVFKTTKGICLKSSSNTQSEQIIGDAWDEVFYMSFFNNGMLVIKNHQSQEYAIYPINKGRLSLAKIAYRIKDHDSGLYGRRTWNMAHLLNDTLIVIPGDDEGGLSNTYCEDIHFFQFDKSLSGSGYVNVNTTKYIIEKNRHKLVNYNIDVIDGKRIGTLTFNEGWHLRFDCMDRVIFTPSK